MLSILVIICTELLSKYIEKHEIIKGIKIKQTELKQTTCADDATLYDNGTK